MRHKKQTIGSLGKLFWFADPKKLSARKNKNLIIHQALSQGNLKDIKKLFSLYSKPAIKREFLKPRAGLYHPAVLKFCADLLGVKIPAKGGSASGGKYQKYIKKIYGH